MINEHVYLLKIRLLDVKPEIWRRFVMPASITLDRLHDVIQIVMGWSDSHLHQFTIGKVRYTEYPEFEEEGFACGQYRLNDLIKEEGSTFSYLYDFGDSWEHELIVEENHYWIPEHQSDVVCLEGARACPPEDVGGVPGYYELCEGLKDPTHEEHEQFKELVGSDYDSEAFDIEEINVELMVYLRWSRDRFLTWLDK